MRQINEQTATQKNQQRCERKIDTGSGARVQGVAVNRLRGYQKADGCDSDHHSPENNKRQSAYVAEFLARQRQRAACQGWSSDLQEKVEFLDEEPERHDGNGRAHPGEERTLIR